MANILAAGRSSDHLADFSAGFFGICHIVTLFDPAYLSVTRGEVGWGAIHYSYRHGEGHI